MDPFDIDDFRKALKARLEESQSDLDKDIYENRKSLENMSSNFNMIHIVLENLCEELLTLHFDLQLPTITVDEIRSKFDKALRPVQIFSGVQISTPNIPVAPTVTEIVPVPSAKKIRKKK